MKYMESGLFSHLFSSVDVGIDLGTSYTRVYIKGRGIVLEEPTVAAVDKNTGRVKVIGTQAQNLGPQEKLTVVRPLLHGVIGDFDAAQGLLETVLTRVAGRNLFFKPRVMVCVPTGVTGVERRAVIEAALQAGASKTYLLEAPMAAALGAGMPVFKPLGQLVVNIGGDTTSAAVISMGHIIEAASLRMGGKGFTQALLRYLNKAMNVQLEEELAEELKKEIGTVNQVNHHGNKIVRGRDLITGLPTTVRVVSGDLARGFVEPVKQVLSCIHKVLENTPPELSADILEQGIVLTGGGARLDGLAQAIQSQLQVRTRVAQLPEKCVAVGTGMALDEPMLLEGSKMLESNA